MKNVKIITGGMGQGAVHTTVTALQSACGNYMYTSELMGC